MTNEKIILNACMEQLTAQQRHEIAAAVKTPEQLAALAAQIITTDENGNETPGTIEDAELFVTAEHVHTFHEWKRRGQSVKKGEHRVITCDLWMFTTKPSKAQREAAAAAGKEAEEHPHFYPTKAHLFSCLQVESNKPAPKGRFGSVEAIKAYNKKLSDERKAAKAAKEAAEKAQAEAEAKAAQEAAAPISVDLDKLEREFHNQYSKLYQSYNDNDSRDYRAAVKEFDDRSVNDPAFHALANKMIQKMGDFISSDREAAAFTMALHELERQSIPEMIPDVQQLDFASIAAGILA